MRPRWADIRDSSNDDSYAEPPCVPPLATDSYREPPEASLENSRIGLNHWLRCASELKDAPTDFAFLLAGAGVTTSESNFMAGDPLSDNLVSDEPLPEVPARGHAGSSRGGRRGTRGGAGRSSARTSRPNTTSNAVGALGGSKEAATHAAAAASKTVAAPTPLAASATPLAIGTAVDATTESDEADDDASDTGTGTASLKRTGQPGAQAPAGKRPRGGSDGSVPLRRLPEASEGTWQRRAEKRQLSVTAGKATPEYGAYTAAIPREHRTSESPRTPDPTDRTVSKRQWDEGVRLWRLALRQWAVKNTTDV